MRALVFSSRSKTEIKAIVNYLIDKWSVSVSEKFMDKLKVNLDLIQESPELFPKSRRCNYHKCVVIKQVTIFYRFDHHKIYIVSVFDTRQNPKKIK
jgi:plasmid stabilization system protein ParE